MKWDLGLAGATLLAASFASAAQAQEIDPDPRFWVEGGVYLPSANTEISLSSANGSNGTEISLEDDLGFETNASSVDLTFGAKIDDDFFGELSYFAIDRNTSVTLDQQIVIEDVTYDAGARVDSTFGSDILRASLGFRLAAKKDWDLAVLLGAYTRASISRSRARQRSMARPAAGSSAPAMSWRRCRPSGFRPSTGQPSGCNCAHGRTISSSRSTSMTAASPILRLLPRSP